MIRVQVAAAAVVGLVLGGKNLDRVLAGVTAEKGAPPLTPNERSAVHSISFDTLRHYGLLSSQLDTLLTQPVSDAAVRHLLLVALAQLQFSKASDHAIVDHAVSATESMGLARAKPLINAVLRNFLRTPDKFKRERFKTDLAKYDVPRWWSERLKRELPDDWERTLLSAALHPPMGLRINARKSSVDAYLTSLAAAGIAASSRGGNAIELVKPVGVNDVPGFREGLVSVQDEGAQWATPLLGVTKGMRVLDACAAPGGKTGHLLESAQIDLVAIDSDAHRMKRVRENLDRLQLKATLKVANATELDTWWDGKPFDRILLDVPCSGSGVTRRHPDIKWLRRETDLGSFARQQGRLLEVLWNCLADGGRLLYVTCSVFRAENQDVIAAFLATHLRARQLPLVLSRSSGAEGPKRGLKQSTNDVSAQFQDGQLTDGQLLPNDHHDGFYFALLEKTA
jgi:16S rRNA (cytosine967-C5)-methyltransferase